MRFPSRHLLKLWLTMLGCVAFAGLGGWMVFDALASDTYGSHGRLIRMDQDPSGYWLYVTLMSFGVLMFAIMGVFGVWTILANPGEERRIDRYLAKRREASGHEPVARSEQRP